MTQWLTVKQTAEYLQMGKSTVYKLIYENRSPFHKALTGYRLDAAELDEWVKSGGAALRDGDESEEEK
jgi:excisionase family DNA binding protein